MAIANSITVLRLILSSSLLVVNIRAGPILPNVYSQLLMGKSLGFFDTRDEALENVMTNDVEDVKV